MTVFLSVLNPQKLKETCRLRKENLKEGCNIPLDPSFHSPNPKLKILNLKYDLSQKRGV